MRVGVGGFVYDLVESERLGFRPLFSMYETEVDDGLVQNILIATFGAVLRAWSSVVYQVSCAKAYSY